MKLRVIGFNKQEWFSNIRSDILAGLVVGLALIPESIAFSAIAGVDPQVGLYASFCIAVSIAFLGGRPAMISAATGAMALLMITLVKVHGLEYLLAATILTGMIQVIAGYFQVAKLMRFVSKAVVYGFLNALAILIFMAQWPEIQYMDSLALCLMGIGLILIYLFPRLPKIGQLIPSPLVCIVVISLIALFLGADVRTVSDLGQFPDTLPVFLLPDIPLNFETLTIIFPYALTLATVGLLETMMTTSVVDEMTKTQSDRDRECRGQGLANIVSGCMGGMAGCAMIGQSIINVSSGARTRLSTLVAGVFLLCLVVFFKDWLSYIPMAALVAIMIMVAFTTFQWDAVKQFKVQPKQFNWIMLVVIAVVLLSHNLALGVLIGVLMSALCLVHALEHTVQISHTERNQQRYYVIRGQIFFSSSQRFFQLFDFHTDVQFVEIDVSQAQFWDQTALDMLNKVRDQFEQRGISVKVVGLEQAMHRMLKVS